MAEAFVTRGLKVTQIEQPPEVLPTVDPELGVLVHDQLSQHGVEVLTNTVVTGISRPHGDTSRLRVDATTNGVSVASRLEHRPGGRRRPP